MNKALVASITLLAAAASQAAHAQSSVTLYGVIDTGIDYISNQGGHSSWSEQSGNLSTSRWGLKGQEDLGGGLSAIFTLENGFSVNSGKFGNGGDEFGRQAFVGLASKDFGQVTLGRQYDDVVDFVAPLSATGSGFGGNIADHPFDNDNLANNTRMNNAIKYRSRNYDGLVFGGAYAFSNSATGFNANSAFTAGAKYDYQGLSVAAAYFQADNPGGIASGNTGGALSSSDSDSMLVGGRQRIYAAAIHYVMGPAAVGFVYTHTQLLAPSEVSHGGSYVALSGNSLTFNNYELNARYALTPALHLGGSYTYTQGRFDANSGNLSPKWNQFMLQADYSLSQRTDVYLEGTYQHVSGGGTQSAFTAGVFNDSASANGKQAVIAIGMRHKF